MKDKIKNLSGVVVFIEQGVNEENLNYPELELIYVLDGETEVTIKDKEFLVKKEGIILINSSNPHAIRGSEDSLLCRVFISYNVLAKLMKEEFSTFVCNTCVDLAGPYEKLRDILHKIIYIELENNHSTQCLRYSIEFEMLDLLIENFRVSNNQLQITRKENADERLQIMINYVNMHYQEQVNLGELAEKLFLSSSSLSRFFKKETGNYFADYVNHVRLHYAANDLLYTDIPITRIAMNNGFSNSSVFSKVFQKRYNMTPSLYRKTMKVKSEKISTEHDIAEKLLKTKLPQWKSEIVSMDCKQEDVDVRNMTALEGIWNKVINIGAAHHLLMANLQYHTTYLVGQLHFTHVRIWNLFSKKMKIRKDYTDRTYNFDNIDVVLDFLIHNEIKPFIDLAARPECALKNGTQVVYFEEECMEFQSMSDWKSMMNAFIVHLIKRYGMAEVNTWIFEYTKDISHENVRFDEEVYSYPEAFVSLYRNMKSKLPDVILGGPSIPINEGESLFRNFLKKCQEEDCKPDFISAMLFPYQTIEEAGIHVRKRMVDFENVYCQVLQVKSILKEYGFNDCPLYITEWNHSNSNRNYLNDSCFRGTYIIKMISQMIGTVDLACFWMGSDWISSYYDSRKIVNGGSGILTKDGIRKPAFYAFYFLNKLGKYLVHQGDNYIITSNGMNSYYILCYNFEWYNYNYYLKDEDALSVYDLDHIFDKHEALQLKLGLKHLQPNIKYVIKKHVVNKNFGSILDEWTKFNCEEELEGSDAKYLRDICIPHLSMEKRMSSEEGLEVNTQLQPREIAFIHIYED